MQLIRYRNALLVLMFVVAPLPALAGQAAGPQVWGEPHDGLQLSMAVTQSVSAHQPLATAYLGIKNVSSRSTLIELGQTIRRIHDFHATCSGADAGNHRDVRFTIGMMNLDQFSSGTTPAAPAPAPAPITIAPEELRNLPNLYLVSVDALAPGETCSISTKVVVRIADGRSIPLKSGTATITIVP